MTTEQTPTDGRAFRNGRTRVDGTCEWMLQDPTFRDWRSSTTASSSILWVHGPPGCGKSVVAQYVTETLQQSINGALTASYFWEATSTPTMMVESILSQFASYHDLPASSLHSISSALRNFQAQSNFNPASSYMAWDLLENTLQSVPSCNLVVDGLDESSDEPIGPSSFNVAAGLEQLVTNAQGSLKLYVSSRSTAALKRVFKDCPQVVFTEEKTRGDMRRFVNAELEWYPSDEALQGDIANALVAKSEGIFKWTSLAMETLFDENKETLTVESLNNLPSKLADMYTAILRKQFANQSPLESHIRDSIIAWALYSVRPPTITELCTAVKFGNNIDVADLEFTIIKLCGSLLKIENGVVKPMHYSLREYFRALDTVLIDDVRIIHPSEAHRLVATTCLRYLEQIKWTEEEHQLLSRNDICSDQPLIEYATLYWVHHCCKANFDQAAFVSEVKRFFTSDNLYTWASKLLSTFLANSILDVPPRPASSAHIAYLFQLRSQILSVVADPDQRNPLDHETIEPLISAFESAQLDAEQATGSDELETFIIARHRQLELAELQDWIPGHRAIAEKIFESCVQKLETQELVKSSDSKLQRITLSVYQAHADFLKRAGKYDRARNQFLKLLNDHFPEGQVSSLEQQTQIMYANSSLGWVNMRLDRLEDASIHLNNALLLSEPLQGKTSPSTMRVKITLAEVLFKLSRPTEAEALCLDLTTALNTHKSNDLPLDYVSALNVLAGLYNAQGKLQEAMDTYKLLVECRIKAFGTQHPMTVWARMQLCLVAEKMASEEEEMQVLAEEFEELIGVQESVLGMEHPDLRTSREAWARLRGR